jgi:hypothetical protein
VPYSSGKWGKSSFLDSTIAAQWIEKKSEGASFNPIATGIFLLFDSRYYYHALTKCQCCLAHIPIQVYVNDIAAGDPPEPCWKLPRWISDKDQFRAGNTT